QGFFLEFRREALKQVRNAPLAWNRLANNMTITLFGKLRAFTAACEWLRPRCQSPDRHLARNRRLR
ncbi:MAG TPA: hypothetical protein VGB07_18245, partial [Blastocatellia bacterium]